LTAHDVINRKPPRQAQKPVASVSPDIPVYSAGHKDGRLERGGGGEAR